MNCLKGIISDIESFEGISLLTIKTDSDIEIKSLVLQNTESDLFFTTNQKIHLLFKETEVIITNTNCISSIENQLKGTITKITSGVILTQVSIQLKNIIIQAIVSTKTFNQLNIGIDSEILALIQATEICISYD